MANKIKNKKAQIAIWIIITFVIVAMLIFVMLIRRAPTIIGTEQEINPKKMIEECAKDSTEEAVELIIKQGGFIEPTNYITYKNTKISYLCENVGYFKTCINQHPLLLNEIKKEILNYTSDKIETCFNSIKNELEKRGNKVDMMQMQTDLEFASGKINYKITRKLNLEKNGVSQNFENYDIEINSPLYDLAVLSMNIVNEEVKYCYFEYVGYMLLYQRWDIKKTSLSDSTKIYSILDKYSGKEMNFAIRGCAIPAGI